MEATRAGEAGRGDQDWGCGRGCGRRSRYPKEFPQTSRRINGWSLTYFPGFNLNSYIKDKIKKGKINSRT